MANQNRIQVVQNTGKWLTEQVGKYPAIVYN